MATRESSAPPADYAELHCHSAFSLLDGASPPEALVARAADLGLPALALTDHDDLGGAVRFAAAGRERNVGAIVGVELTVGAHHLVLLAESGAGYANLATLVTRGRMDRPRGEPSVPLELVARYADGLVALTGCPGGEVPARLAAGDEAGARRAAFRLREIFGDRLYVECWDHGLAEERRTCERLVALARALGRPWVVTNDVHY
ncbi:MAG TPA: PHP domain-containing protein, partial [Gemmatimonadales bacterium]|nr:PHP domain-containing protein [Gemmatimonadales bacterium]